MKPLLMFCLLFLLILTPFAAVEAQQPSTKPSDDNACYPGGAMFRADQLGQGCPDDWHWMCGWFLARYLVENPLLRQTFMPEQCRSLLLTLPVALGGLDDSDGDGDDNTTLGGTAICINGGPGADFDLLYSGVAALGNGIFYNNDDPPTICIDISNESPITIVPDGPDADAQCNSIIPGSSADPLGLYPGYSECV
jgi:hypothetical protein